MKALEEETIKVCKSGVWTFLRKIRKLSCLIVVIHLHLNCFLDLITKLCRPFRALLSLNTSAFSELQKNSQECYNGEDAACQIVLFDSIVNILVGHTDEAHIVNSLETAIR